MVANPENDIAIVRHRDEDAMLKWAESLAALPRSEEGAVQRCGIDGAASK